MKKYVHLKKMLRETLAAGAAFGVDIKRKGKLLPHGDSCMNGTPTVSLCLIGTVEYVTGERYYPTFLGLDRLEKVTLEAGFCGWDSKDQPDAQFGTPLFKLGQQLAQEFATDFGAGK